MGKTIDNFRDNLSEWLRRQTRNLLGFARAGSNPAVVVFIRLFFGEVEERLEMDCCIFG